mmetsp:Transcript_2609/g.5976  ORF Transcript_2609/g.5976 Transcript_2609/m.5976 type:complete len:266 (-) Transcript_2609:58-855(-)
MSLAPNDQGAVAPGSAGPGDTGDEEKETHDSHYPLPPPFFELYGDYDPAKASSSAEGAPDNISALIATPPPPIDGAYWKFKNMESSDFLDWNVTDFCQKLYKDGDKNRGMDFAGELRRLNKASLHEFVLLLRSLSGKNTDKQSSLLDPKIEDKKEEAPHERHLRMIQAIFGNMIYLTNMMRGHQGRQTLIDALQQQIERRKKRTKTLLANVQEAKEFLSNHPVSEMKPVAEPLEDGRTTDLDPPVSGDSDNNSAMETLLRTLDAI